MRKYRVEFKIFIRVLFIILILVGLEPEKVSAVNMEGGKCGEHLTWSLDEQGTLTIEGYGEMFESLDVGYWNNYKKDINKVIIKNGATNIGQFAFSKCVNLRSAIIPNTVKKIDVAAFQGCESLENITLPNKITIIELDAFRRCESLKSIVIPNSVTKIEDYAFQYCDNLEVVKFGNKLEEIGVLAFQGCSSLKNVTIPDSVKILGDNGAVFCDCDCLEKVVIGSSVTHIGQSSFSDCTALKEVYFCGDAPEFGNKYFDDVFENVTATVYYPNKNSTWKDYNMTNHGGNLKWVKWDVPISHAVVKLKTFKITPKGIQLSWGKTISAKGYYIYRKVDSGSWKKVKTSSSCSWTDTSVKNGGRYTYKICAYNTTGQGHFSYSRTLCFISKTSIKKIKRTSVGSTYKIIVSWKKNSKVTGYQLEYATNKKFSNSIYTTILGKGNTSYTYYLNSKTKYYFRVRAYKKLTSGYFYSSWSTVKSK